MPTEQLEAKLKNIEHALWFIGIVGGFGIITIIYLVAWYVFHGGWR